MLVNYTTTPLQLATTNITTASNYQLLVPTTTANSTTNVDIYYGANGEGDEVLVSKAQFTAMLFLDGLAPVVRVCVELILILVIFNTTTTYAYFSYYHCGRTKPHQCKDAETVRVRSFNSPA